MYQQEAQVLTDSHNRTILELKLEILEAKKANFQTHNRTILELKFRFLNICWFCPTSHNRTILELKFGINDLQGFYFGLIIVPFWN